MEQLPRLLAHPELRHWGGLRLHADAAVLPRGEHGAGGCEGGGGWADPLVVPVYVSRADGEWALVDDGYGAGVSERE
jgi:hypothetical protein